MPIPGFISWAHKDHTLCKPLWPKLEVVERMFNLSLWRDAKLCGGDRWDAEIQENLNKANIIIQCVTTNVIASDYIFNKEIPAIAQRGRDGALVIPVLLQNTLTGLFKQLHMLPHTPQAQLKPVAEWKPRDRGYEAVQQQIADALRKHGYKEKSAINFGGKL